MAKGDQRSGADAERKRPGVVIYFDSIRPALNRLNDSQCGALFRAIIDYAEFGVLPELDPLIGMVFDLLRPKIDMDAEKYAESCEQREYASYVSKQKRAGEAYLPYSEWQQVNAPNATEPVAPATGPF